MKREFKEGDRVFVYDFGYEKCHGTIHKNTKHPNISEWYIEYDNGEEYAVLELSTIHLEDEFNDIVNDHFDELI